MPGPTAASEFRRGLNPYNLMVGALAALALGAVTLVATRAGVAPDLFLLGAGRQALGAALGLFVIITGMHTATHTYFGWRFARGIRAAGTGEHARATRLLAPVERPGMSHYDPGGHVQKTLEASRAALDATASVGVA
ncbi:MAG TPA: hypothetical protein VMQ51_03920 [Candidatus Binatia bacterium]|nr:hypothetical protein [Candidatus Binatia bacterium]